MNIIFVIIPLIFIFALTIFYLFMIFHDDLIIDRLDEATNKWKERQELAKKKKIN